MKATRHIVLGIGFAGLSAAIFALANGGALIDQLMTFICSACLIFGYFQLGKTTTKSC